MCLTATAASFSEAWLSEAFNHSLNFFPPYLGSPFGGHMTRQTDTATTAATIGSIHPLCFTERCYWGWVQARRRMPGRAVPWPSMSRPQSTTSTGSEAVRCDHLLITFQ